MINIKTIKCKFCGNEAPNIYKGYCQVCWKYFCVEGKHIYDLPNFGEVKYAENGDAICHICGKAFRKLGAHIYNAHKMKMRDYCDKFGLFYKTNKASNKAYREHMKKIQKDYCITDNLLEKGKPTRLKKGSALRYSRKIKYGKSYQKARG